MNNREEAKKIRVLWEEMGYHPWKDNAFIVLDALEEAEEEIAELKLQLTAVQSTLEATQTQLEIRIAENMPGGRYSFGGAVNAARVKELQDAGNDVPGSLPGRDRISTWLWQRAFQIKKEEA